MTLHYREVLQCEECYRMARVRRALLSRKSRSTSGTEHGSSVQTLMFAGCCCKLHALRPPSYQLLMSRYVYDTRHYCMYHMKGSQYSITERRVPEMIPVLGSQPASDVSHKPDGRLPLLSARPAVTPATLKRAATNFAAW